ncbi:type 1 fimbrial protein [Pseudomonas sp. CK-NBRI-02]|uniref:fimbrial protein n=1 Tax=Pseudomonas sp. CK-NBRI-02 TaxID=2249759 RepID=UPI0005BBCDC4|nr:fimbrial protein [Pseudomonas sp. CK-NBRI-02]TYO70643.1 type 1 fimbrial protein [Pseudomonas sp. CK-NBRI-02]
MKKFSLAALTLSLLAASAGAFAADATVGGNGKISFTGVINNDACSVDGANSDRVIAVDMGNVSIKDMGTAESPASGRVTGKDFNLNVNCNVGTKVSMIFDPNSGGSGLVTGKSVLALTKGTGTAQGVGIALLDHAGKLIDLRSPANAMIQSEIHGTGAQGGDATLSFSAAYVTTGAVGTATAGRGDATLPFILQYE